MHNDLLARIWVSESYLSDETETFYKDIFIAFAKESHIFDKSVLGIASDNFLKYYFIGKNEFKKIQKKEVSFGLFFWLMRLKNETTYSHEHVELLNYSELLKNITIIEPIIKPGMVLKRNVKGYTIKPFEIDSLLSKLIKQKNQPRTHV